MNSPLSTYPTYPLYERDKNRAQQRARERNKTQDPEVVLETIGVKPGMVIGEVGAGEGYYAFPMSRMVGNNGRVYATEINSGHLSFLKTHIRLNGFDNISVFAGQPHTPGFPRGKMDLVLMAQVFHFLKDHIKFLKNITPCLKPGAHLVIIQWDKIKMGHPEDPELMTKEELERIVIKAGYEILKVYLFLPEENIFICRPKEKKNIAKQEVLDA